jgi:hypothetical protein
MCDIPSGLKLHGDAIGDAIDAFASAFPDVHRELFNIYAGRRRALSPTFPAGELVFFILGGWWPRIRRGASRPARAAWVVQRLEAARW